MASRLAGQRAKFTKALADYSKTDDEEKKQGAARRMAEVLIEAPKLRFTEVQVTQGQEVPSEVRRLVEHGGLVVAHQASDDPDQRIWELQQTVDASEHEETAMAISLYTLMDIAAHPIVSKLGGQKTRSSIV
jgi:hypothetical protein